LKIVFFTFYYPPDLCAGSFRAISLAKELSKKIGRNDELHIITTHPNRYIEFREKAKDFELISNVRIHRIKVPSHRSSMISQIPSFAVYAFLAFIKCKKIRPNLIIGTSSRLMTGVLAGISAYKMNCKYFIDLRDIFSETISELISRKVRFLGRVSEAIFNLLEKRLLEGASGVNVVSEGFYNYFRIKGINTSNWTFFPNGVDREFIDTKFDDDKPKSNSLKVIMYAGNIGSGQGLEKVLPSVAKKLEGSYHFIVIGGGGASYKLVNAIRNKNVKNIEILPPVSREKLIKYYQEASILFLHLNDISAFKRVLPSKIFEYSVIGKPIVAGLSGYSAKFMNDNVPHAALFNPGDASGFLNAIKEAENLIIKNKDISVFVEEYSRQKIMDAMAKHILSNT